MTALATGSSVTLTLKDGDTLPIATNGGFATVVETPVSGSVKTTSIGPLPTRMVVGPFNEGATVVISNLTAVLDYDSTLNNVATYATDSSGNATGLVGPGGATPSLKLNPEMYWTASGKTSAPTAMDTGQAISVTGTSALVFGSGGITTQGAVLDGERFYAEAPLVNKVTRMGCKFKFLGATPLNAIVVLVPWLTSKAVTAGTPATGVHLTVMVDRIRCNFYDVNLTNDTQYFDYKPETVMAVGVEYTIEWFIVGDVFTIIMPDGRAMSATNTGIQSRLGRFPSWEVLRSTGATDGTAVITKMWASDQDQESAGLAPVARATNRSLMNVATLTAVTTSAIQSSSTVVESTFFVAPVWGPTGKCLVTLTGEIQNKLVSNAIICAMDVRNAADASLTKPGIFVLDNLINTEALQFTARFLINLEGSGPATKLIPMFYYVGGSAGSFYKVSGFNPWTLTCEPVN